MLDFKGEGYSYEVPRSKSHAYIMRWSLQYAPVAPDASLDGGAELDFQVAPSLDLHEGHIMVVAQCERVAAVTARLKKYRSVETSR